MNIMAYFKINIAGSEYSSVSMCHWEVCHAKIKAFSQRNIATVKIRISKTSDIFKEAPRTYVIVFNQDISKPIYFFMCQKKGAQTNRKKMGKKTKQL